MSAIIFPFPFRPRPGAPEVTLRDVGDALHATVRSRKRLAFLIDAIGLARAGAGPRSVDWSRCVIAERRDGLDSVYDITVPHAVTAAPRSLNPIPRLGGVR